MFPFQLLCPSFADHMPAWIQVSAIGSPAVGIQTTNAEWFKQRFEFYESPILT